MIKRGREGGREGSVKIPGLQIMHISPLRYLNSEARSCYWYRLLTELSKLLQYKPGQEVGRKYMEDYIPLDSFLESEAAKYERGTFTP